MARLALRQRSGTGQKRKLLCLRRLRLYGSIQLSGLAVKSDIDLQNADYDATLANDAVLSLPSGKSISAADANLQCVTAFLYS